MDDKNIIYKWKLKGFYSFIKLLIYLLRNFLAISLGFFYGPLKSAVNGDLAALILNKKTIERKFFTDSNDLIFFPPYDAHYGDVINLLYFSKSIFETRGKKLTIVSPDNKIAKICKMFEHTDFIYYPALQDKSIRWVKGLLYIFIFGKIRDGHVNFINIGFFFFFEEIIGITNLSLFERKLGIKLTMKNVSLPLIDFDAKENLNNKIASLGFVRNKTVLVNIESRTITMNISLNFWKKTINRLVKAGFGVILNNRIEELDSPEVKYLQLDWDELIPAAEYCSNVISIRNGICDLLQFTDTKLIVIYPVEDINGSVQNKFGFKFSQLYLKELMSNPPNLTELAYTPSLEDELISRIVKLIASQRTNNWTF